MKVTISVGETMRRNRMSGLLTIIGLISLLGLDACASLASSGNSDIRSIPNGGGGMFHHEQPTLTSVLHRYPVPQSDYSRRAYVASPTSVKVASVTIAVFDGIAQFFEAFPTMDGRSSSFPSSTSLTRALRMLDSAASQRDIH